MMCRFLRIILKCKNVLLLCIERHFLFLCLLSLLVFLFFNRFETTCISSSSEIVIKKSLYTPHRLLHFLPVFSIYRSLESRLVPLMDPNVVVLVTNSNVKHEIDAGEYASRRAQCEAAAKTMGLKSLRDATDKHLTGRSVYHLI